MNTGKRIVAAALSGALVVATSTNLSAADSWSPMMMKPLRAVSLDAGSKHVVGYFLSTDGRCKLTLMIAEASRDEKTEPPAEVMRVRLAVDPGRSASVDTTEGKLLQFDCQQNAQAMSVAVHDQIASGDDVD
jgi:hypothetical protein